MDAPPKPGTDARPSVAVWKFASCDGCQLTLLDCEDELLDLAGAIRISYFLEATSAVEDGPFDVSIVEGSVSTPADVERIHRVRELSMTLVTIGACATSGGIQALRNFADVDDFLRIVYAQPQFISTLATVTPIAAHVPVDYEVRGCPITKLQMLEVLSALLIGRKPQLPSASVCEECKRAGNTCVLVADRLPCLGPVTHAGCGALCPSFRRGCYGCFGPSDTPNTDAMIASLDSLGLAGADIVRLLRTFNATAPAFEQASTFVELRTRLDSPRERVS